ncbi:MAG: hypothetical protein A2521_16250 [Deltaproteobacteria bacterium RIFOXYD12_FULL_57_12]|nr:MAG: hypothetical protein A2521_16250 [Deltaproteobacteria bacterium RIFOXYD12_FULL_57_12]
MRRKLLSRIVVTFFLSLMGVAITGAVFAKDIDIGLETMTLKSDGATQAAIFPHRTHQKKIGCMDCHHLTGQTMTANSCDSCHNQEMKNEELNTYKKAAHVLCRGCHKEASKAGKAVPVKCSGCHPNAFGK